LEEATLRLATTSPPIRILQMNSAEQLRTNIEFLRRGLAQGVSNMALDQLVANVNHALIKSFENGDLVTVAETGLRMTTRLQVLNAINLGHNIEVSTAAS